MGGAINAILIMFRCGANYRLPFEFFNAHVLRSDPERVAHRFGNRDLPF